MFEIFVEELKFVVTEKYELESRVSSMWKALLEVFGLSKLWHKQKNWKLSNQFVSIKMESLD